MQLCLPSRVRGEKEPLIRSIVMVNRGRLTPWLAVVSEFLGFEHARLLAWIEDLEPFGSRRFQQLRVRGREDHRHARGLRQPQS